MKSRHKLLYWALILVFLAVTSFSMGSLASSKDIVPRVAGMLALNDKILDPAVKPALQKSGYAGEWNSIVVAADDIIPADRKIDWRYGRIPGGIPERMIV